MSLIQPYAGLPDKQRLIAAMRGQPTDRVPNFEVLIEDQHVERLLGRKAGKHAGCRWRSSQGSEAAEGRAPCTRRITWICVASWARDVIVLENLWTPIRQRRPDGSIVTWNDRSLKSRADLERIVWPGECDLQERIGYVREYVEAAAAPASA